MTTSLSDRMHQAAAASDTGTDAPPALVARVRRRRRRKLLLVRVSTVTVIVLAALAAVRLGGAAPGRSVDVPAGAPGAPTDASLDGATAAWVARFDRESSPSFSRAFAALPDELRRFVVAKGGVPDAPVVNDPSVVPAVVEVVCGAHTVDVAPLAASRVCSFVFRYDFKGTDPRSTEQAERVCLRRQGTAPVSACGPGDFDEVRAVAGTDLEAVVYWRSTRLPAGGLSVDGVSADWGAFAAKPVEVNHWRNCVPAMPCPR